MEGDWLMSIFNGLLATAMMGEGGGGGGGGSDLPVRHIIFNSVAMDNTLGFEYVANFDDEPYRMVGVPYINGTAYYLYSLSLADGLTGFDVGYVVFDDNDTLIIPIEPMAGRTVEVTGDITLVDDGWWYFHVTGNGTITIS